MVNNPSPLQTHAHGLMLIALGGFVLSLLFHVPTLGLIGLAIAASIGLIASIRHPTWRWLSFFITVFIQVIFVRLLEDHLLALAQCLSLQIGVAAALIRILRIHPIDN